jgi:8-oxo-dGTP pyrophosphatase MutT (NUDIX family)
MSAEWQPIPPTYDLRAALDVYRSRHHDEADVVARFESLLARAPRCYARDFWPGHVTGSAWLVNASGTHVLLTHHRKLGSWFQLGGHSDGDSHTLRVALREAEEESGLAVAPITTDIFDLDVHEIPARREDPTHHHFDVRFALRTMSSDAFRVSAESHALSWVEVAHLRDYTTEESMLRMARKWQNRRMA